MNYDINWGLAQPVNTFGQALQGFERGMAMGAQQKQKNALMQYAQNPTMEAAAQTGDPRLVMQFREDQSRAAQQARRSDVTRRAAGGDAAAMDELAGIDLDSWSKLDGRVKEQTKQATAFMGQAIMDISRLPEQARPAAWASYVQRAEASGMDIPTQYEAYSPEALNAAAAETGMMEKLIKQFEPDYRVIPEGGYLENVNQRSRATPLQTGPQQAPGPVPGTVVDGYRFKGGNPNDPNAWEQAGGPTRGASGSFRP